MRVTDQMRFTAAIANQQRVSENLLVATKKASTGQTVDKPSDDPVAFAAIGSRDAAIQRMQMHLDAAQQARGDAELAESTLAQVTTLLGRAREIGLDMANGEKTAADRAGAAKEVTQIRSALQGLANTKGARGYLFGGTKTDTPPFDAAGAFAGNDNVLPVEIADGVTVAGNSSGARAFTASGGRDLLADLGSLATALSTNDPAGVQNLLDPLDQGQRQIVDARADAGMTVERLASASDIAGANVLTLKEARSHRADADLATVFAELNQAKSAYDQSLTVTKQILSLTVWCGACKSPRPRWSRMLVVRRRVGERIVIGNGIEIVITEIGARSVRVGVLAPRGILVLRGEVHDAVARANAVAADVDAVEDVGAAEPDAGSAGAMLKEIR
jgi:flagellar hook-associated protein 3 FlgL